MSFSLHWLTQGPSFGRWGSVCFRCSKQFAMRIQIQTWLMYVVEMGSSAISFPRPIHHVIWHLFVAAAAICHWIVQISEDQYPRYRKNMWVDSGLPNGVNIRTTWALQPTRGIFLPLHGARQLRKPPVMPCFIIPMDPSVLQWSGGWLLGDGAIFLGNPWCSGLVGDVHIAHIAFKWGV